MRGIGSYNCRCVNYKKGHLSLWFPTVHRLWQNLRDPGRRLRHDILVHGAGVRGLQQDGLEAEALPVHGPQQRQHPDVGPDHRHGRGQQERRRG